MFDNVIQDTGEFKKTGELFSRNHYEQVYRVLKSGGMFYHYVPNPNIKTRSRSLVNEVVKRLKLVGFRNIKIDKESSSVICVK